MGGKDEIAESLKKLSMNQNLIYKLKNILIAIKSGRINIYKMNLKQAMTAYDQMLKEVNEKLKISLGSMTQIANYLSK